MQQTCDQSPALSHAGLADATLNSASRQRHPGVGASLARHSKMQPQQIEVLEKGVAFGTGRWEIDWNCFDNLRIFYVFFWELRVHCQAWDTSEIGVIKGLGCRIFMDFPTGHKADQLGQTKGTKNQRMIINSFTSLHFIQETAWFEGYYGHDSPQLGRHIAQLLDISEHLWDIYKIYIHIQQGYGVLATV